MIDILPGDKLLSSPQQQNDDPTYIELTLISSDSPLTKTYSISEDGTPRGTGSPFLSCGTAERILISQSDFAAEFAGLLTGLESKSCLVLGALSDAVQGNMADITTKDRYNPQAAADGSPLIWRGKAWLGYRDGQPSVLGLDHDAKDLPEELRQRVEAFGGVLGVLSSVCPTLATSARVSRPSVSTGIVTVDTGQAAAGGGCHIYLPIEDGGDAKDFVGRLHDRLVLAGWGYAFVSEAGSVHVRSLIDTAASGVGERLWFEANAMLMKGLQHVDGARDPEAIRGPLLNTADALSALTAVEKVQLRAIETQLQTGVASQASIKRQQHAERVRERIAQRGGDEGSTNELVKRLLDADQRGVLTGEHQLNLDDGRIVSVLDILADRGAFHRVTCADPLEPNYGGGVNKAILYTDGHHPRLYSHAHGGRLFTLALDEVDIIAALSAAQNQGRDPAKVATRLAPDAIFASGGWPEVQSVTGWNTADLTGILTALTTIIVPTETGTELVPVNEWKQGQQTSVVIEPLDAEPAIDLLMQDFNSRFAVVAEGGTTSIVRLAYNADLGRRMPVSMTLNAFRLLVGNQYIKVPRKGGAEDVSAATLWLTHPARRTCPDGFGIDPTGRLPETCFNLWQGFGVEERQGDWSKLNQMIFEVLAAGDEDHYRYIIQWLAHLVQRPHQSPGVALVFRGEEGVGKGTLGRAIMRLMRPHAMQITHTKHLTGAFNAHMRDVLFLFADEAFFAADRANEGTLKGLITEEYRVNEAKGRDASLGRNRIHLMMASNNDWVVPASADARRYAVFDVSAVHKQDAAYFGPVNEEMDTDGNADGIAAMLYDLRHISLDVDFVRKAPETAGLRAQRIASLRGPARWFFDVLTRGYVGSESSVPWRESYSMEELFGSYRSWSDETREAFPADRHAVGKYLASMFPPHRPRLKTQGKPVSRPPGYRLGTLTAARINFAEHQGIGDAWADEDAGDSDATE